MEKFVNKYTGEVLPYQTVASYEKETGVANTGEDLCRKEDFEPIGTVIARFLRSGGIDEVLEKEYAFTDNEKPSLLEDTVFDAVDQEGDILDQQMDLENYLDGRYASDASVSAVEAEGNASDERSQKSEEQAVTSAEEKPSE